MAPSLVVGLRTRFAALLLVLIAIGGPAFGGQAAASPEGGCAVPRASPVAERATPAPQRLATPAAGTPASVVHGQSVVDTASMIEALRGCGLKVEESGTVEQPFLTPESGTILRVSGGDLSQPADVQVFEYRDAASARADAAQIGPDGNPTRMMILWIAPPHFFRIDRVIVLYLGEDQVVLDLLTALLGPPFAGR